MYHRQIPDLTRHARRRCQQRGIRSDHLLALLDHHDCDAEVGGNCRVLRISRSRARSEMPPQMAARLARLAVIVSEATGEIVTVMHDDGGRAGIADGGEEKDMDHVIDFNTRKPRGDTHESKVRRARMLESAKENGEPFSPDDQRTAAANTHRLLTKLQQESVINKRDVAITARLGGDEQTDPTKRLDPYTLPEDATPARIGRIAKKPGKYFEIAAAIADLSGRPKETCICEVFEGCSYGSGIIVDKDWDASRWRKLSDSLLLAGNLVIRSENLQRYWRDVLRVPGEHDFRRAIIRLGIGNLNRVYLDEGLAGFAAYPDDLPPIPSVLLGERVVVQPKQCTIKLTGHRDIAVVCSLSLEVRLAVAPVNAQTAISSVFEFRSRLDVIHQQYGQLLLDNPYCDGSGGSDTVSSILINGRWEEVTQFPFLGAGEADYSGSCEHAYLGWREINPALLSVLFGEGEAAFEMTNRKNIEHIWGLPACHFSVDEPAFFLRQHITSNALPEELEKDARRCKALLDEHRSQIDEAVAAMDEELERRWAQD